MGSGVCTFIYNGRDVIGYVTEVGAASVNASGSRTVEFSLTNERKRQVRVTLWGHLGDAPCVCPAQHRLCSSIQTRYLRCSLSGRPSGIITP
ncbi:hypothetical protein Hanom_Chr15g01376511 [Helianthus anomalus]